MGFGDSFHGLYLFSCRFGGCAKTGNIKEEKKDGAKPTFRPALCF